MQIIPQTSNAILSTKGIPRSHRNAVLRCRALIPPQRIGTWCPRCLPHAPRQIDNLTHPRLACTSTKAELQRTLDSNEAVHILADFIRQGSYYVPGVMQLLVNAGTRTKDGVIIANEQMTIPYEILPGYGTPGHRTYINEEGKQVTLHDKPDIVSIIGWK